MMFKGRVLRIGVRLDSVEMSGKPACPRCGAFFTQTKNMLRHAKKCSVPERPSSVLSFDGEFPILLVPGDIKEATNFPDFAEYSRVQANTVSLDKSKNIVCEFGVRLLRSAYTRSENKNIRVANAAGAAQKLEVATGSGWIAMPAGLALGKLLTSAYGQVAEMIMAMSDAERNAAFTFLEVAGVCLLPYHFFSEEAKFVDAMRGKTLTAIAEVKAPARVVGDVRPPSRKPSNMTPLPPLTNEEKKALESTGEVRRGFKIEPLAESAPLRISREHVLRALGSSRPWPGLGTFAERAAVAAGRARPGARTLSEDTLAEISRRCWETARHSTPPVPSDAASVVNAAATAANAVNSSADGVSPDAARELLRMSAIIESLIRRELRCAACGRAALAPRRCLVCLERVFCGEECFGAAAHRTQCKPVAVAMEQSRN